MSWSVSAVGKPAAVAASIRKQADAYRCAEPEEAVKQSIVIAVEAACGGFDEKTLVKVSAQGSMYRDGDVSRHNSAALTIEPLFGYVE